MCVGSGIRHLYIITHSHVTGHRHRGRETGQRTATFIQHSPSTHHLGASAPAAALVIPCMLFSCSLSLSSASPVGPPLASRVAPARGVSAGARDRATLNRRFVPPRTPHTRTTERMSSLHLAVSESSTILPLPAPVHATSNFVHRRTCSSHARPTGYTMRIVCVRPPAHEPR